MIEVLIVDDDFRVAQVHAAYVDAVSGFRAVGVAHTAQDALAAVRSQRPDLLLLDTYLPDQLGTRLAVDLAGECDVLMVTADDSAESVRAAVRAGAVNYIVKPFASESLAARLRAYERYRSRVSRGSLTQDQIDAAFAVLHEGDRPRTPKGQSPVTAKLVREALKNASEARTAVEVADELGISRATAQRYLAALAEEGHAVMDLRYGSTGRPEHQYRWR
ncbi:response regulator [Calidifontibacter sp. DB0510]|uniref:Transcriptional regulatory protein n=1 Tax=Metallococcus carri TaxID=1656884 RepID=A0A967EGS9_9MICO|nr:response regulator [Metallococcus carri]NHN55473.1 response regulator [Metallococcus carri]NOP38343.1 response regulator [Calidifontibacter sp. DB2511S]